MVEPRYSPHVKQWLGLCKLENEILKKAKKAEKSHFKTKKCNFWAFLASFKTSFSSLHNPNNDPLGDDICIVLYLIKIKLLEY